MPRRRLVLYALVLLVGYTLLCGAGGIFVAEAALHPGRRVPLGSNREHAEAMAQLHDSQLTDVSVTGVDGNTLRGWLLHPRQDNHDFVMLLHGLSDNRIAWSGMQSYL
jgi:cephalosporin-C deacetylase-like acetyl esterase